MQGSKRRTGNNMYSMNRYILVFIIVLSGLQVFSQSTCSNTSDSAALYPKQYGTFKDYAFLLNGKLIKRKALLNNPEAKLNNVFSNSITLEGKRYAGAVYFHTEERYAPHVRYADQPAYFINGRQVSPYQIRLIKLELYKRISKSAQDTTINGGLYRGSIHVDTDEDFFADRIALPDLIEKYTGLKPELVTVRWLGSQNLYNSENDTGTIIRSNFPLYSFKIGNLSVEKIEVDRVHFAQGKRYVVHLSDYSYKWSKSKAALFFEEPLALDTVFPCYVSDYDMQEYSIFTHAEIDPMVYNGLNFYLKKLSSTMELLEVKPSTATQPDSITVQFIVMKNGMITALSSVESDKPGHGDILSAIKKNACVWSPAIMGGRPVFCHKKMVIFYSIDNKGNIQSLDRVEYRYDHH